MTTIQKVIKYFAIALAIFLVVNIVSTVIYGLYAFVNLLGLTKTQELPLNVVALTQDFDNTKIKELEIDIEYANLTIKNGEQFYLETNNDNINFQASDDSIQIKEKSRKWFSSNENIDVTLYIPENFEYEKVKISAGAGKLNIEEVITQKIDFEIGAGEAQIEKLMVKKEAKIEGGAGKITIEAGKINDLDLDMGVGKVEITTLLTGKSELNAGIGSLDVTLIGNKDEYKTKVNKGLGSIKIDGEECANGEVYGKGENEIQVDGGIGNIRIEFEK